MPQPLHIASRKHHAESLADELRFLPEQLSQRHCTRGLDHKLESFIGELRCLYNFLFSHHKEPRHVQTENREGQLPKARSKAIGKRVRVGHGNNTVLLHRIHRIQGAGRLTVKDGHARSECLCRETEIGKQDSTRTRANIASY